MPAAAYVVELGPVADAVPSPHSHVYVTPLARRVHAGRYIVRFTLGLDGET